jgi:hypothetical protein
MSCTNTTTNINNKRWDYGSINDSYTWIPLDLEKTRQIQRLFENKEILVDNKFKLLKNSRELKHLPPKKRIKYTSILKSKQIEKEIIKQIPIKQTKNLPIPICKETFQSVVENQPIVRYINPYFTLEELYYITDIEYEETETV